MITQRLLTRKQAAKYLGIHPKTLWQWANLKKVPFVMVSGRKKYDKTVLDRMIETDSFPQ